MPDKRLLYFTSARVTAYLWQSGTLRKETAFKFGENGVAEFSKYVAEVPDSLFYVLADIVEEIISDAVPLAEHGLYIESIAECQLIVNGSARLDDINEMLGSELQEEGIDTIAGLIFNRLLGATVVIEAVFAIPGIGSMVVHAAIHKDFPVIQGVVLSLVMIVIALNLVIDVLYTVLDPRVSQK